MAPPHLIIKKARSVLRKFLARVCTEATGYERHSFTASALIVLTKQERSLRPCLIILFRIRMQHCFCLKGSSDFRLINVNNLEVLMGGGGGGFIGRGGIFEKSKVKDGKNHFYFFCFSGFSGLNRDRGFYVIYFKKN